MASIEVGGAHVHYIAPRGLPASGRDGSVVLFVHGVGGSTRQWEPVFTKLGPSLCPIAVDLPGHGASDGVAPASADTAASFVSAFLTELGLDGPVAYVGHSLGGVIGLRFATLFPRRLRRLVLVASTAKVRVHPSFVAQASSGQWDFDFLRGSFAPEIPDDVTQLVLSDFPRLRLPAGEAFSGFAEADFRTALPSMDTPTLVITGDDDVIISPRHSQFLARAIPGACLAVVAGAGHYVHVEQPELVAREIERFCAAIDHPPLHFRFAVAADVEAIVALAQAAYRGDESRKGWTTEADLLDGERISAREVAALIADPETRVVLCERQGELVGMAKLIRQGERCFFGLFSVQPSLQGAGIGKRLLAECERVAQAELGCRQIRMQVFSIREELLAYYERRGYRRTGELEPYSYAGLRPGEAKRLDLCFEALVKEL